MYRGRVTRTHIMKLPGCNWKDQHSWGE